MAIAKKQMHPSSSACIPPIAPSGEDLSVNPELIQESFQVWLQEMACDGPGRLSARPLTPQEIIAVGMVTMRESHKHRRWPREVVERFVAAKHITRPPASYSVYGELNMAARRFKFWRMSGESYATIVKMLRR